jgi:MFS family permease
MVMLFAITANSIRNVWDQNIMSSFIYLLSDRSSYVVGFLTGTTGLVQALMAPVMGFFADKYPRVTVLRSSGIIGVVGILLTIPSVIYGHLLFIFLSMAIWGLFWASVNPTLDAVLADSAGRGQRSRVYSWRYVMLILGTAVGPFVTLLIFSSLGDHWSVPECQVVIGTGLCLFLAPVSILFLFQPLNAPDGGSGYAALPVVSADDSASSSSSSNAAASSAEADNDTAIDVSVRGAPMPLNESHDSDSSPSKVTTVLKASSKEAKLETLDDVDVSRSRYLSLVVPATIALGDIITGLASGMTIKFFPIFFMNDLHMKPVALSLLYTVTPLCTAVSGVAAQRFSLRFGRGTATVVFKVVGLSFMAALCYLAYNKYDAK